MATDAQPAPADGGAAGAAATDAAVAAAEPRIQFRVTHSKVLYDIDVPASMTGPPSPPRASPKSPPLLSCATHRG